MFDEWYEKVEKVSEGWDGEDGLQNVAAFLQAQGIPPPTPAAGRGAK